MIPKNIKSQTIGQNIGIESQEPEQPEQGQGQGQGLEQNNDWLKKILDTPTGKGSVESYDEHPLNFTKTRGMSHILRGISGFFVNLDRAIIDIAVGGIREVYDRYFKKASPIKEGKRTASGASGYGEAANGEPRIL